MLFVIKVNQIGRLQSILAPTVTGQPTATVILPDFSTASHRESAGSTPLVTIAVWLGDVTVRPLTLT